MWSNLMLSAAPQPDGWDDEEDFSESVEDEEQEEPNAQQKDIIPPSARIAAGVGMLGGHLTRFLAEVAQPIEYEDDEDDDGWDDEELDLNGHEDLEPETSPAVQSGPGRALGKWLEEGSNSTSQSKTEFQQQPNSPENLLDPPADELGDGWNEDELNLDAEDVQESATQPLGEEATQSVFASSDPEPTSVDPNLDDDGWNDDDDLFESLDNDDGAEETQAVQVSDPFKNEVPVSPPTTEDKQGTGAEPDDEVRRRMSLVDRVPLEESKTQTETQMNDESGSLAVFAAAEDQTRQTIPADHHEQCIVEEELDAFDNENELAFVPVVDHLPKVHTPISFHRTDSLAVQGQGGDLTLGEASGWADDEDDLSELIEEQTVTKPLGPAVVDHTPTVVNARSKSRQDSSVGVLASEVDTITVGDEYDNLDDQDSKHVFGPVVDLTPVVSSRKGEPTASGENVPFAPMSGSLAVNAAALAEEFQEDEAMDETIFGDSTIGGGLTLDGVGGDGWEEDNIIVDDEDASKSAVAPSDVEVPKRTEKKTTTFSTELTFVVDYTPSEMPAETGTIADPSVNALVADEDLTRDTGLGVDAEVFDEENELHFGLVVDHTPQTPMKVVSDSGEISLAVHASALKKEIEEDERMDESCFGDSTIAGRVTLDGITDDGWVDDNTLGEDLVKQDPSATKNEKKTTTFSVDLAHVVDHTPSEMPADGTVTEIDPSVAALGAGEDLTRDTGVSDGEDVYDDENEIHYGPVVDHLPQTQPVADSGANSMAAHATLKKDFEEHERMDDSTLGALSGWDQDDDDTEVNNNATERHESSSAVGVGVDGIVVVDHTPSEIGTATRLVEDPSVGVVGSVGLTKEDGDVDSTGENVVYGPVVDQTPQIPATGHMRSDSVMVQLGEDEDTIEGGDTLVGGSTIGETTIDEAVSEGDNEVDEDMPGPLRSSEDQLVDHVPTRPESRFGDASTGVAADPSEVLSEVDDMTQEGAGNFGPVVDVTPIQPLTDRTEHPSGAASTVVFAPSVPADDLDGDESEVVDDSWGQDDPVEVTEAEPNPQSGNDEPVDPREEQLVDFIPAANVEPVDIPRDAVSELTLGGQSHLHADPKEDDFLPVVDQTPTFPSAGLSHASISTQITASECRALDKEDTSSALSESVDQSKPKVVVDQLPHQHGLRVDSVATLARSQLSEDDEEDDSKYGPVVDHLPTPRLSSAPSRGGSTVDALATVSEADSDAGGDGWDDEIDFDASEGCISLGAHAAAAASTTKVKSRNTNQSQVSADQERMSVRFDPSVSEEAAASSTADDHVSHDVVPAGPRSMFFDPESVAGAGWENKRNPGTAPGISTSFAEADTPPSTPYRKSFPPSLSAPSIDDSPLLLPITKFFEEPFKGKDQANSAGLPYVEAYLDKVLKIDTGSLIGSIATDDGRTVDIDVSKVLQDEVTKRRLLEEEGKLLRQRLQEIEESSTSVVVKKSVADKAMQVMKSECEELRLHNQEVSKALARAKSDLVSKSANLGQTNCELQARIVDLEAELADVNMKNSDLAHHFEVSREVTGSLENETSRLQQQILSLQKEKTDLSSRLESHIASSDRQKAANNSEIDAKVTECQKLLRSLEEANTDLTSVRNKNISLELENTRISEQMNETVARLEHKVSEQHKEMSRAASEDSALVAQWKEEVRVLTEANSNLHGQLSSLLEQHSHQQAQKAAELEAKVAECDILAAGTKKLEGEISSFLQHLSQLESEKKLMSLQVSTITSDRDTLEEALMSKSNELAALKTAMASKDEQSQNVLSSVQVELNLAKDQATRLQESLDDGRQEIDTLRSTVQSATEENNELVLQVQDLQTVNVSLESSAKEVFEMREIVEAKEKELHTLKNALQSSTEERNDLMMQVGDLSKENRSNQKSMVEIHRLKAQTEELRSVLFSKDQEMDTLRASIESATEDNNDLEMEVEDLREEVHRLKSTALTVSEQQFHAETRGLQDELLEKGKQIQSLTTKLESMTRENTDLLLKVQTLESVTESRTSEHANMNQELLRRDKELDALRASVESSTEEINDLMMEIDDLKADNMMLKGSVGSLQVVQSATDVADLETRLQKSLDELERARADSDGMRNKFEDSTLQLSELRKALKEKDETEQGQEKEIFKLSEQLSNLQDSLFRASSERDRLEDLVAELKSTTQTLELKHVNHIDLTTQRLNSLIEDVQTLTMERDRLSEENEELLVQFALVKQQLDIAEEHLVLVEERHKSQEQFHQDQMISLEADLQRLSSELDDLTGQKLSMEEDLARASVFEQERDSHLAEIEALVNQNTGLQREINNHKQEVEELRGFYKQAEDSRRLLESESAQMREHLERVASQRTHTGAIEQRVTELELSIMEKDRLLASAARHGQDLEGRVAGMAEISETNAVLQAENMELQSSINDLRSRMEQAEEANTRIETDSNKLRVQLQKVSAKSAEAGEAEKRLVELELKLAEKEGAIAGLEEELSSDRLKIQQMVEKTEHQNILRELSQKRQALKQKTALVEQLGQKVSSLESEFEMARHELRDKDRIHGEATSMQRALDDARASLARKEAEIQSLRAEIAKLEASKDKTIAQTLEEAALSGDDIKTLRYQIVSLAIALERSETKRAEAVERLQAEREMNSDSLRRLSESMKRYYSSVSLAEM